jgi:polysaccharide biosynthesis transport protein
MTEFGTEPSFRAYLQILRRRKWWVGLAAALGLAASLAFSLTAQKEYSATAQLLVQPSVDASAVGVTQPQPVTQTDVETELQLVTSAPVQQAVRAELNGAPAVSAAEVGQTNVMAITATSAVPSQAALIANAYATAFVQYQQSVAQRNLANAEAQLRSQISSLTQQLKPFRGNTTSPEASALLNQQAVLKEQLAQMQVSGAVDTGDVVLVTPAQTPTSPSSPKPTQDALLGLAAGLALGLGAAFLRDSLDDKLSSKEAAEHAGGAPVLAMTPVVTSWRQQPLVVTVADPTSPAAESYRSLRTSLQFVRQEGQIRSIVVTSPGAAEGKTATLANLGVVFAQAGERVVLVSCDLRRPRIGAFFDLDEQDGLTSVLLGERTLEQVLVPVAGHDRLTLLPAGPVPPNPAELLNGAWARDIFVSLSDRFDLVLIDSPPVLPVTDAAILSRYADATLMLAAAGQTRRGDLHRAVEKLDQVGTRILGLVLNKVSRQTGRSYGYSYGYGYKPYQPAVSSVIAAPAHPNGSHRAPDHSAR